MTDAERSEKRKHASRHRQAERVDGRKHAIGEHNTSRYRVVSSLPLRELWDDSGPLVARSSGYASLGQVRDIVSSSPVTFVLADAGMALVWIPARETFRFWKTQARFRIATPGEPIRLEDFPGQYAYLASIWELSDGKVVVALERQH